MTPRFTLRPTHRWQQKICVDIYLASNFAQQTVVKIPCALPTAENLESLVLGIERSAALPTGLSGPLLALAFRDQPPVRDATAFVAAENLAHVVIKRQRPIAVRATVAKIVHRYMIIMSYMPLTRNWAAVRMQR